MSHSQKTLPQSNGIEGFVHANTVKVNKGKSVSPCFSFRDSGVCSRKDCRFAHNKSESKSDMPALLSKPADVSASAPSSLCGKCGDKHGTKSCKFAGKCSHCGILGHKEEVCMKKKAGKPKAMYLNADGFTVVSNLCVVQELVSANNVYSQCLPHSSTDSQHNKAYALPPSSEFPNRWMERKKGAITEFGPECSPVAQIVCVDDGGPNPLQVLTTKANDGTLCEQFFADTGANRHIYPNSNAAASFNRESISIGTAQGNKSMTSDGVGSELFLRNKHPANLLLWVNSVTPTWCVSSAKILWRHIWPMMSRLLASLLPVMFGIQRVDSTLSLCIGKVVNERVHLVVSLLKR